MARPAEATLRASSWHIAGCGRMGSLAAAYLQRAGASVTVIRDHGQRVQRATLVFDDHEAGLELPVVARTATGPIQRLIVACKTPYTRAALAGLHLAPDALVLRLQNGIGSLDGLLTPGQRCIEVVTSSAVKSEARDRLRIVAENASHFGGGAVPVFWPALSAAWPGATWAQDIGPAQRTKLAVNAVLNPLTALYDVPNGALIDDETIAAHAKRLAAEADAVLAALDPGWPGNALAAVQAVARATAANTSSMRADCLTGAVTEIEAINGWLIAQGNKRGIATPEHQTVAAAVRARHPGAD